MTSFKLFATLVLTATAASTVTAETHCPGNAASVPLRIVNRHQMIVSVSINHAGPYNFLVDTGTQITMVDPSLAAELHLSTDGAAEVSGAGIRASASFAQLDLLAVGHHAVANPKVLVYDLHRLRSSVVNVVGILGEDFLEHFDMLIDNAHNLLCLDDTRAMRESFRGQHIPLLAPTETGDGAALPKSLIVAVRLSDGMRPVRLKLDSGTNTPFMYNASQFVAQGLFRGNLSHGAGVDGGQQVFVALHPQDVRIGSVELTNVTFFTLAGAQKDRRTSDFDGLLTLGLFRRVFVDHVDHYAVLEP